MIVPLVCSINLLAKSKTCDAAYLSSTGEVEQDSVLIAYDDLRTINSKLIELKYEKEINSKLREVIAIDSSRIAENVNYINHIEKQNKSLKTQRTIGFTASVVSIVLLIILL